MSCLFDVLQSTAVDKYLIYKCARLGPAELSMQLPPVPVQITERTNMYLQSCMSGLHKAPRKAMDADRYVSVMQSTARVEEEGLGRVRLTSWLLGDSCMSIGICPTDLLHRQAAGLPAPRGKLLQVAAASHATPALPLHVPLYSANLETSSFCCSHSSNSPARAQCGCQCCSNVYYV